jgi:putative transposase
VFFTVTLADRRARTLVEHVGALRAAVRVTRAERPFRIHAWVVLPDHLHAVWSLPEQDADYSTRWRLIKARFSRGLPLGPLRSSHAARNERGIWQRRFWERHLRDARYFKTHLEYCWFNPVKHRLVEVPEDLSQSLAHRDIRSGSYGW